MVFGYNKTYHGLIKLGILKQLRKIYIFYKVTKKYKIARRKGNCTLHNNQRFVFDPDAGLREIFPAELDLVMTDPLYCAPD